MEGLGFELLDELVRGVDEIATLVGMSCDHFWRNGSPEYLAANPLFVGSTLDSKATGSEFAIDFGRCLLASRTHRPALSESEIANDGMSKSGTVHGCEGFFVKQFSDIAVGCALFPELVNALKHLWVKGDLLPLLKGAVGGKEAVMTGEPDDFDFDGDSVFGGEDDFGDEATQQLFLVGIG